MPPDRFHLRPGPRVREPRGVGRRVGLDGVLARLDRRGSWSDVPGTATGRGMRWDERDVTTTRWFPQGVTAGDRPGVLLTSWYGHGRVGWLLGSRISVISLEQERPRYAHVTLVRPGAGPGRTPLHRVHVHAGGLVLYRGHLFVAASSAGLRWFRLDDIRRLRGRGHVLPQAGSFDAARVPGSRPMVHSFISLQHTPEQDFLVAGEYGRRDSGRHRLVRYALDRSSGLLVTDAAGRVAPVEVHDSGIPRMQGVVVGGSDDWLISASAGEGVPGDLWSGRPGAFTRHRGVLPTGPEDLALVDGRPWTLSEWPGRRWVFPVDAPLA